MVLQSEMMKDSSKKYLGCWWVCKRWKEFAELYSAMLLGTQEFKENQRRWAGAGVVEFGCFLHFWTILVPQMLHLSLWVMPWWLLPHEAWKAMRSSQYHISIFSDLWKKEDVVCWRVGASYAVARDAKSKEACKSPWTSYLKPTLSRNLKQLILFKHDTWVVQQMIHGMFLLLSILLSYLRFLRRFCWGNRDCQKMKATGFVPPSSLAT